MQKSKFLLYVLDLFYVLLYIYYIFICVLNKTQALRESMNMGIWVIGYYTQSKF